MDLFGSINTNHRAFIEPPFRCDYVRASGWHCCMLSPASSPAAAHTSAQSHPRSWSRNATSISRSTVRAGIQYTPGRRCIRELWCHIPRLQQNRDRYDCRAAWWEVWQRFLLVLRCDNPKFAGCVAGDRCLLAPNVQLYTAGHPLDPVERNGTSGPEFARLIKIGNDCWIVRLSVCMTLIDLLQSVVLLMTVNVTGRLMRSMPDALSNDSARE